MTKTDLAVLERWADPRALLGAGQGRLVALVEKVSHGQQGAARAAARRSAARAAADLNRDHPAVAWSDLAAEIATEVRLLQAVRVEFADHAEQRAEAYRWSTRVGWRRACLPWPRSVPPPSPRSSTGPTGSAPVSSSGPSPGWPRGPAETGDTDRKGQLMSKAGNALLRTTLVRAANNARRQDPQDPQLAKIYYIQMVERGAEHLKACCVVAASLAWCDANTRHADRLEAQAARGTSPG